MYSLYKTKLPKLSKLRKIPRNLIGNELAEEVALFSTKVQQLIRSGQKLFGRLCTEELMTIEQELEELYDVQTEIINTLASLRTEKKHVKQVKAKNDAYNLEIQKLKEKGKDLCKDQRKKDKKAIKQEVKEDKLHVRSQQKAGNTTNNEDTLISSKKHAGVRQVAEENGTEPLARKKRKKHTAKDRQLQKQPNSVIHHLNHVNSNKNEVHRITDNGPSTSIETSNAQQSSILNRIPNFVYSPLGDVIPFNNASRWLTEID